MRKLVGVALFLCCSHAPAARASDTNVSRLAGRTQAQVSSELKSASKCKSSKYGISCVYGKGEIEIVFIAGKADWIKIDDLEAIPYDDTALLNFGLSGAKPSFKSASVIRWNNTNGFLEISIFKGRSGVDYAYFKVVTQ